MPQADEADVSQHIEETEPEAPDAVESEAPAEAEPAPEQKEEDHDEVVVSIGEDTPPPADAEPEPEFLNDLRKRYREEKRARKELEAKLAQQQAPAKEPEAGPEPTLEAADYDEAEFKRQWSAWFKSKQDEESRTKAKEEVQRSEQQAWQAKLADYGKGKSELKVSDYDEAEEVVLESLNTTQQGVILEIAKNPALLVYAIGKHPAKAKELASITNPLKFAVAVADLEREVKATPRKQVPPPERVLRASAPASGAVDSELERLRADADRTGDRTKVAAYLNGKRKA